jgi:hypothetical protein
MAYLSDSDIMDWNHRLPKDSAIWISARYSNTASHPSIAFTAKNSVYEGSKSISEIEIPIIKYFFSFSISASREEEFDSIFDKLAKEPFENYVIDSKSNEQLKLDKSIVKSLGKTKHKVYEKEYLRKEYSFDGKISSIMAYISLLENAIEYFSMIWGYGEDGQEYCLLKYPIGNIVSPVDDKSKDFLILDYKFCRFGKNLVIDYLASEMLAEKGSSVLKYGPMQVFSEKKLTWSRNGRIDDILG